MPKIIVRELNCINTIKAIKINTIAYKPAEKKEIFLDGNGLDLVLFTLLSNLTSTMSFIIHPALLIRTEPRKKRKV